MDIAYRKQILFAGVFGLVVYAGYNESSDSVTNYKRGLLAAAFVLVCQGILDQYTGPFVKRFPRFWRGVARYTMIYLVVLIFILYQTAPDARGLMRHLYPELGQPVKKGMHTYDDNCEFEWDNIKDNLDHYYAMHLVGWFVAALMIRDTYVLHFWSILDEILELSWQHVLPHFRECWWDHVLVDVLFSNTPAIILGMFFIRQTGLREFDWLGRKGKNSIAEWDLFKNHRRFGGMIVLVLIMMSNFLTGFFIINSLWIPPKNFLNVYRLTVWFLLGSIAIGELYDDVSTWGTPQRLTTPISNEYRWICCGVTILEGVISYKFRHDTGNIVDAKTPWYIWLPWLVCTVTVLGYYLYLRMDPKRTSKGGDQPWEIEERRKNSTRLAEKEKKQKAKEEGGTQAQPVKSVKNVGEAQSKGEANNTKNKNVKEEPQKKQNNNNKVEPLPVKTAEPEKKTNKKAVEEEDSEWKVAGGSKGNKQQQQPQKSQKQEKKQKKQEVQEEEREQEEPVKVEEKAPVEDEWKEIKSVKAVKKDNKKKRD